MDTCKVCKQSRDRLFDGKCLWCLSQETKKEEKRAMDAENDNGGFTEPEHRLEGRLGEFLSGYKIPLPDLTSQQYVAERAGYDVGSRAWKKDGKELMKLVATYSQAIISGDMDFGSAPLFLERNKDGCEKRLVTRIGSACVWEYVKE